MKRAVHVLTILLLLIVLTGCEVFLQAPEQGNVYAILIALDYKNTTDQASLDGTLGDARELKYALKAVADKSKANAYHSYLFIQEGLGHSTSDVVQIGDQGPVNTYPSSTNLLAAFQALGHVTTAKDLIIVTYSGHGAENGELALADTGTGTTEKFAASKILDALQNVPGRKLMILDTCYSGVSIPDSGASHSTLTDNNISKWYSKYWDSSSYKKPDVFVMTASTNTLSYEQAITNGHSHGVFTNALLNGLGWTHPHTNDLETIAPAPPAAIKNSIMSVDTLYEYVKEYKSSDTWLSIFLPSGRGQHPMVSGGSLDMVLFTF